jgi:1,4-dihydroxy-2-naphthoate octaprenyltransferase
LTRDKRRIHSDSKISAASVSKALYFLAAGAAVLGLFFLYFNRWWAGTFGVVAIAAVYWGSQLGTWK